MLRSHQELEEKRQRDQARAEQVKGESAGVIAQHDDLAQQILADLDKTLEDIDALQTIKQTIDGEAKEVQQVIADVANYDVRGLLPTIREKVQSAKILIVVKER